MGSVGPLQLVLLVVVALLVFGGRGRISGIMGDLGKGITSFRKGISDASDETKEVNEDDLVDVTPEKDKTKASS
ncbi:MAG: twin-arginine translocase TatA/TatE family subunit [Pseudomonadota bacterium]